MIPGGGRSGWVICARDQICVEHTEGFCSLSLTLIDVRLQRALKSVREIGPKRGPTLCSGEFYESYTAWGRAPTVGRWGPRPLWPAHGGPEGCRWGAVPPTDALRLSATARTPPSGGARSAASPGRAVLRLWPFPDARRSCAGSRRPICRSAAHASALKNAGSGGGSGVFLRVWGCLSALAGGIPVSDGGIEHNGCFAHRIMV